MRAVRYWGVFASLLVTAVIAVLVCFVAFNGVPAMSVELFFGDTKPLDAIFGRAHVWDGLWTPIYGTLRLILFSGFFAVPMGLSIGIYTSEYTGKRAERAIVILMESLAGIPSIVVGLFGFVLILFLRRYFFPANTSLLLAAFCLSILVLPALSLNTYTALKGIPSELRLTAASVGLGKYATIFKVLIPAASEGIFSGLILAAGRCAEDTAVILMTGAVASTGSASGIFEKFEALPFFIFYTSANYQNKEQLVQVFAAAFMLLLITFILLIIGMWLQSRGQAATSGEKRYRWIH